MELEIRGRPIQTNEWVIGNHEYPNELQKITYQAECAKITHNGPMPGMVLCR